MCICLSWHHSANQPESSEVARNHSTPSEVFCCVSLDGVLANEAQLCSVRRTNTCVSLEKNPLSCVLSHACFSRTSFLLCLLQLNIHESALAFYLCQFQLNILSCVCPCRTPTNWLSKEPLSLSPKLAQSTKHCLYYVETEWCFGELHMTLGGFFYYYSLRKGIINH